MNTEPNNSTTVSDVSEQSPQNHSHPQSEKAWRILLRLLWLMVILLASGLVWLYTSFTQLSSEVQEKLAKIDTVDTRLNDMDDRLFALTSLYGQTPVISKNPNNAQDSDIIKIQLLLINELYKQGDYNNTLIALDALTVQLDRASGLSFAIKETLKQSLKEDIAYVTVLKNQPDAWQSHIIKMQELQAFLRSQERRSGELRQDDILLHDTNLLLSLAIGSANSRDRNLMTVYLQDAKQKFESYLGYQNRLLQFNPNDYQDTTTDEQGLVQLNNLSGALYWFNDLLANSPKTQNLKSTQILK